MIQRKHKDKLFNYIFGNEERKDYLLSLYNALNDKDYTDPADLTITTIEDIIYLGYKNDVSCIVATDEILSLYEHQSTFNPNMPIRGVFYFAKLYEKFITINKLNVYGTAQIKLPTPQYYVFYVGKGDFPERMELKLTDMFAEQTDILECKAIMLNINAGYNQKLIEKCKPLRDYSYFIDCIYQNKKICDTIETAIDKAVNQCIEENVLGDILLTHKAEVKDMLFTEFNEEEYIEMVKKESLSEGIEIGKKELIQELINEGKITLEEGAKMLGIAKEELEKQK